jgi:hypothetical protein
VNESDGGREGVRNEGGWVARIFVSKGPKACDEDLDLIWLCALGSGVMARIGRHTCYGSSASAMDRGEFG